MTIRVVPYEPGLQRAVRAFNDRLQQQSRYSAFTIPRAPQESTLAEAKRQRYYLALDDGSVRGGFLLQRHVGRVQNREVELFNLQSPISEGVVDSRYRAVGPKMIAVAVQRWPNIYAVGMGGRDRPLPQLLDAMGWRVTKVPFFFLVRRVARAVLEHLRMRGWPIPERLSQVSRWNDGKSLGDLMFRPKRGVERLRARPLESWGEWSDSVWRSSRDRYEFAVNRNRSELEFLYPDDGREMNFQLFDQNRTVGWLSLIDTSMAGNRYFGNLRVGTFLDGDARDGYLTDAAYTARDILAEREVDVIVSNQLHGAWREALQAAGFVSGPSNFLSAFSPSLSSSLDDIDLETAHVTRGDGDGRIHL